MVCGTSTSIVTCRSLLHIHIMNSHSDLGTRLMICNFSSSSNIVHGPSGACSAARQASVYVCVFVGGWW